MPPIDPKETTGSVLYEWPLPDHEPVIVILVCLLLSEDRGCFVVILRPYPTSASLWIPRNPLVTDPDAILFRMDIKVPGTIASFGTFNN